MHLWEADGVARELVSRAGFDPDEPASPLRMARALLEREDAVQWAARAYFPGDGRLEPNADGWIIYLRQKLPRERARFAIAHELAEWALRDLIDEHIEDACNAVAAAILMPRRAFLRAVRARGVDLAQLALDFAVDQTSAALRLGEVERPVAVRRPGLVRTRAGRIEDFAWPSEETILRWSRDGGPAGVARHELTDDTRRVALVVDLDDVG